MSATSDLKQSPLSSSDSPGSSPKYAHTLSADSSPPRKPRIEVEYLFGQSHHILRITVDFQAFWRMPPRMLTNQEKPSERSRIPKEPGRSEPGAQAAERCRHIAGSRGGAAPSAIRAETSYHYLRRADFPTFKVAVPSPAPRRAAALTTRIKWQLARAHTDSAQGLPSEPGVRSGTRARTRLSGGPRPRDPRVPKARPRAPAEQLRGPPRTSPPLQASPNAPFAWRGFPERTPRVPAPPLQATEDRGPRLAVPRGGERSLSGLPSSERPAGRLGRERGWPHSPFPRAVRAPTPLPRARTCRPARPARAPPAPAARGRPPQTHLGRSGGGRPSSATWPGSPCERLRALAASTAAGRTGRHGPSCGRSARGLCRWAGALPAAPFRLRGTILWRFGAARRKPLTARVRRAAQ
ncbi:nascent polypeptide-associated complex subunit alpha, muscle-specific form-like [Bos javanicus]|uniref:nascent polypeptide-associated complex subunit alpha, muscle-specific form-like n=1 Tax=Bos javanicus TaxID=9906 RepID=UPI002AA847E3|nr:nascent polypeptide-associated complex subunit alpha, muscle-specific form-like [Bos javanicus]